MKQYKVEIKELEKGFLIVTEGERGTIESFVGEAAMIEDELSELQEEGILPVDFELINYNPLL